MTIRVLGTYSTEQEAIDDIDVHALAGLMKGNMIIYANKEHAASLREQTNVTVKTDTPEDEEKEGMMDKLKDMFSNDKTDVELHTHNQLVDFGLTNTEARQSLQAVTNGQIVVFADDEMRMGHQEDDDKIHHYEM